MTEILNPADRTTQMFSQNYNNLQRVLKNITVAIQGTDKRIILTDLVPYSRAKNLERKMYHPMMKMQPGDLWACYWTFRKTNLPLIVAMDGDQVGACIEIKKASRIDSQTGKFIPIPKEGDITFLLGLQDYERGRLRFLDDSNVLYLENTGEFASSIQKRKVTPQEASQELEKLFEI